MKTVRSAALSCIVALAAAGLLHAQGSVDAAFDRDVRPVVTSTCAACHSAALASGGLNLVALNSAATIAAQQETWEKILRKVRSGEMPPKGVPRPPQATMEAMARSIEAGLDQATRNAPRDPGRVTVRRLNRNEYANSVRDLLGVKLPRRRRFPQRRFRRGLRQPGRRPQHLSAADGKVRRRRREDCRARRRQRSSCPSPSSMVYDANSHTLTAGGRRAPPKPFIRSISTPTTTS